MRTPTEFELRHIAAGYDPTKAREYYLRTRKLKGRHKGQEKTPSSSRGTDPRLGKRQDRIHSEAKSKQRKELADRILSLDKKLNQLEAKIREMEHAEAGENRKSKAKKERAAKEKDQPKTAAEKAKAARDSKQYKDKHKQELRNKAKKASDKSGGGSSSKKKSGAAAHKVSELKALATKVKGQIAVAKQKLAAL